MKLLKHSAAMIKKTFRNYMMLSITVFLTFTFLLGFLIYTDSGIYNKYKELMGNDYKIILSHNGMDADSGNKINILTSRLEEMGDTHFYYIKRHWQEILTGINAMFRFCLIMYGRFLNMVMWVWSV